MAVIYLDKFQVIVMKMEQVKSRYPVNNDVFRDDVKHITQLFIVVMNLVVFVAYLTDTDGN